MAQVDKVGLAGVWLVVAAVGVACETVGSVSCGGGSGCGSGCESGDGICVAIGYVIGCEPMRCEGACYIVPMAMHLRLDFPASCFDQWVIAFSEHVSPVEQVCVCAGDSGCCHSKYSAFPWLAHTQTESEVEGSEIGAQTQWSSGQVTVCAVYRGVGGLNATKWDVRTTAVSYEKLHSVKPNQPQVHGIQHCSGISVLREQAWPTLALLL